MLTTIALAALSFLITFISLPHWIKRAKERGLVGQDFHKRDNREVAELGGIVVVFGTSLALLLYIALETFYFHGHFAVLFLATIASLLMATVIGIIDDILGWRLGLKQREKVAFSFLIPIPIMVINAGHSTMTFPFLGPINLGLAYPLIIVPVGIIGSVNGFNMLAGYNGLEAGLGTIILTTLGLIAWHQKAYPASLFSAILVASLIAFLFYNKYPSKVFPGDTLTYPVGASIAMVAILGNIERFALMLFFPFYIEFLLKVRGKFNPEWTALVLEDGSLIIRDKWYTLPHVVISFLRKLKGKAYEYEVVLVILALEIVVAFITIISYLRVP